MLDHDDYMPSFVLLTEAKAADVTVAQWMALNSGSILVLDRSYPGLCSVWQVDRPGRLLRRLVVWDEKNQKQVEPLTNHHKLTASIVADIYKDRWKIELFFKALKQTFVCTSSNALEIQTWTALIALLSLKWLYHLSLATWSLSNLAAMLRLNFFTYRELRVGL
ncbi:transposase [Desulfarculales bacterium]